MIATRRQRQPHAGNEHPTHRAAKVDDEISDLILDGDIAKAMTRLREAMDAELTLRVPRAKGEANQYAWTQDWATRLAAIKLLLAYRFGNPASTVDMKLIGASANEAPDELTHEEMVDRLRSSGTDLPGIVTTWLSAAKKVAESGPLPADLQETVQTVEKLTVIDV